MQRRKADATTIGQASIVEQQQSQDPRSVQLPPTPARPRGKRNSRNLPALVFFVFLLLLGIISILSPSSVERAEQDAAASAKELLREALAAEGQMEDFFHRQRLPPQRSLNVEDVAAGKQMTLDATEAMKRQPSKWVDGEKKLKIKLKELAELQKAGKELGVPVLTRWLGEDFPAWVPEGGDKDEWETKRKERYAAMAAEELVWRARTGEYLEKKADAKSKVSHETA